MCRFLLVDRDGQTTNPAAFVTAVPNWSESEVLTLGDGQSLRIVHINLELDEDALEQLYEQGINRIWVGNVDSARASIGAGSIGVEATPKNLYRPDRFDGPAGLPSDGRRGTLSDPFVTAAWRWR
jgi:hypothetical protein